MNKYLICLLISVLSTSAFATCTATVDVFGNTRYNCGGTSGTLSRDVLGNVRDSRTGTTYRTDVLGTIRGSDGFSARTDVLGNTRYNDGTSSSVDVFGNTRFSDGTVCRTNVLGVVSCQ